MKQLSKLVLNRADIDQNDILSKKELKYIMGGYGGNTCVSTSTISGSDYKCWGSGAEAEKEAGSSGWWCCNCAEAKENC